MLVFGLYGYEGIFLLVLLKELGIVCQSLYDIYGMKYELFVFVFKFYVQQKIEVSIEFLNGCLNICQSVEEMFNEVVCVFLDDECCNECFIINSVVEQVL